MSIFLIKRRGFTMLELVFVITILGIVASIGSTIMAQLFENYIVQRAMHKVSLKTELAAAQIANRLSYALPSSVVVHDGNATAFITLSSIAPDYSDTDPQTLEWIGMDNDSFSTGVQMAGWSGYCDTNFASTTGTTIRTPGSNLTLANTVIGNLSNGKSLANSALLFNTGGIFAQNAAGGVTQEQNASCYGYNGDSSCIHHIAGKSNNITLTLKNNLENDQLLSQHYKLAWSAYAIVPTGSDGGVVTNTKLFDLHLKYNYQPWDTTYFNNGASDSLLLKNVTSFKFAQQGNTVRFKLCATEKIGDTNTTNISVCKEKVVIR